MTNRTSIITIAAIAFTGAAALVTPSQAQLGGAVGGVTGNASGGATTLPPTAGASTGVNGSLGVPNVTTPSDSVRQGAAGINAAQAEATRTSGDAVRDAQATAENNIARTGTPDASVSGGANANAAGQSAGVNANANAPGAVNEAARTANAAANRGANTATGAANTASGTASNAAGRAEEEATRQLNREQAANANASGNLSTR